MVTREYGYVMINEEALLKLARHPRFIGANAHYSVGFRQALDMIHDMIPEDLYRSPTHGKLTAVYCTSTENYYIGIVEPEEINLEEYSGFENRPSTREVK